MTRSDRIREFSAGMQGLSVSGKEYIQNLAQTMILVEKLAVLPLSDKPKQVPAENGNSGFYDLAQKQSLRAGKITLRNEEKLRKEFI